MKKVHFHLGAHKTASTLIQRTLLKSDNPSNSETSARALISIHQPHFRYSDFRLPYLHMRNEMMWRRSEQEEIPDNLITRMAEHLSSYLNTIPADHIVISDENLIGNTLGHPTGFIKSVQGGLYPVSAEISEAFLRATSRYDVSFRLYKRDIDSLIVSSYRDWISKLRSAISLDEFTESLDQTSLNWEQVVDPWKARFESRFDVKDFESIHLGQKDFLREFSEWCDLPPVSLNSLNDYRNLNRGFNSRQIEIALAIIPYLRKNERDAARRFLYNIEVE